MNNDSQNGNFVSVQDILREYINDFSVMVSCGMTVRENGTYFVNNGYPSSYDGTGSCQITLMKPNPDVSQYRFDNNTKNVAFNCFSNSRIICSY